MQYWISVAMGHPIPTYIKPLSISLLLFVLDSLHLYTKRMIYDHANGRCRNEPSRAERGFASNIFERYYTLLLYVLICIVMRITRPCRALLVEVNWNMMIPSFMPYRLNRYRGTFD